MSGDPKKSISYRDAGVDIDRAANSLSAIAGFARATASASAAGEIGHFGGIYQLPAGGDRLLIASADGIGTKIKIAFVLGGDAHKRVGGDLVNHCVNRYFLACGARPLFFLRLTLPWARSIPSRSKDWSRECRWRVAPTVRR